MNDGIIKQDGTSRLVKASFPATYEEFREMAANGTLTMDILFNAVGWQQLPTFLNKANLLKDDTAALYGMDNTAVPDNVFKYLFPAMPVGTISWLASENIPSGFLKCDGSSVSKSDYPELYAVIGDTFGEGTETTFKLPDLIAKFIRGAGTSGNYKATFGNTQEGSFLVSNNSEYPTVSNSDYSSVVSNYGWSFGGASSDRNAYGYGVRPYNIALTPIIKCY